MSENLERPNILKNNINMNAILWLIPFVAIILVLVLVFFGGRYRKSTSGKDIPAKLVGAGIDSVLNPLKLTANHFESLSKDFAVPEETLLRHFNLLKKLVTFESLLILDSDRNVISVAGNREEVEKIKLKPFLKGEPVVQIIPVILAGEVSKLLFAVPMKIGDKTNWLVAQIKLEVLASLLPPSVHMKFAPNPLRSPLHPAAPKLYIEIDTVNRPIWPLLLGELMLGFGIFILLLTLKNRNK
ncbi:hypothetical protein KKF34_04885 [Myxococcota bacterium]|nr:hypothetical protein [Myxococcota bacterium]MBU1382081.1 hypothetical protein [Myxococcota bacterium]MBU1496195.1 hypothetical protein [Myxococcota bacterium]